jgi:nucleoid-associated protein YgaU
MKKPIATFTSIAALALAALGGTYYLRTEPVAPKPAASVEAEAPKPVEKPKVVEAPKPVEQPKAAEVQPKPEDKKPEQVAVVVPKPEPAPAPAVEATAKAPEGPAFDSVRVEPNGETLVAGRADPDSDVTLKWNGNVVGKAKANADGSFVVIPEKPLAKGTGALTLEMSKNGAVVQSEGSVAVVVKENAPAVVAKLQPETPTQVTQNGAAAEPKAGVYLSAVDYDTAGNIVFSGKAAPGATVRFYVDNIPMGEGVANADGAWSFKGTNAVKPGTHMLRADAVDASGKVVSRIELPFLREDAETVAAAQVAVAEPAAPVVRSVEAPKAADPEQSPVVAAAPAPEQKAIEAPAEPETQVASVQPAPEVPRPVVEPIRKLVIQPGNSLWKLSREVYGKGRMYTVIFEANRDQVRNPNRIYPGQILTAPKAPN